MRLTGALVAVYAAGWLIFTVLAARGYARGSGPHCRAPSHLRATTNAQCVSRHGSHCWGYDEPLDVDVLIAAAWGLIWPLSTLLHTASWLSKQLPAGTGPPTSPAELARTSEERVLELELELDMRQPTEAEQLTALRQEVAGRWIRVASRNAEVQGSRREPVPWLHGYGEGLHQTLCGLDLAALFAFEQRMFRTEDPHVRCPECEQVLAATQRAD